MQRFSIFLRKKRQISELLTLYFSLFFIQVLLETKLFIQVLLETKLASSFVGNQGAILQSVPPPMK